MQREALALAGAFAVQALAVAAIPAHESWIRASGRTVPVAVEPVDPYDPVRGYYAAFTYPGIDAKLAGFDRHAADGSSAWVVLKPLFPGGAARPVRIVRSPVGQGDPVLRVHYAVAAECYGEDKDAGCRKLRVTPDAWYGDEAAVRAIGPVLREHRAVAELRITADGDASLIRLRPSRGGMGHGG